MPALQTEWLSGCSEKSYTEEIFFFLVLCFTVRYTEIRNEGSTYGKKWNTNWADKMLLMTAKSLNYFTFCNNYFIKCYVVCLHYISVQHPAFVLYCLQLFISLSC